MSRAFQKLVYKIKRVMERNNCLEKGRRKIVIYYINIDKNKRCEVCEEVVFSLISCLECSVT